MNVAEWVFVISLGLVLYAYIGYPLALRIVALVLRRQLQAPPFSDATLPSISIIIPVFNEARHIATKIRNTAALSYPRERIEVIYVSDGSTDGTADVVRSTAPDSRLIELPERGGKAAALNAGLAAARHDIVVFTDASIMLEDDAIRCIARWFALPDVGCVSGEDRIEGGGGEALYGRYELLIRRLESRIHSIVGASGCFYAQRRSLCDPFTPGMAPDFLSVLRTVAKGYRALADGDARGTMVAVHGSRREFQRKVRTILRGITALAGSASLLNPLRNGAFAFALWSHKIGRWIVPFCLLALLGANAALATGSTVYLAVLLAQAIFYIAALGGIAGLRPFDSLLLSKAAAWFAVTNAAALVAWIQYSRGVRQELWTPSARSTIGQSTNA
jgi:glycosyltransferase involved in cell wall biosynthesis